MKKEVLIKMNVAVQPIYTNHIRFDNGGITLVSYIVESDTNFSKYTIVYGAAFCSKNDQYSKKIGRKLALTRLFDKPFYITFDNQISNILLKHYIFIDMLHRYKVPEWLKREYK